MNNYENNDYLSIDELIEKYGYDLSTIDFAKVMILPLEDLNDVTARTDCWNSQYSRGNR